VRLKSAYIIKAESVEKDPDGIITAIHCTYDPHSLSGSNEAKRKVKGTLHWVSAAHALDAEVRLYDRLFNDPDPDGHKGHNFKEFLNPDSLTILNHCKVEPSLGEASELDPFLSSARYFNLEPESSLPFGFLTDRGLKDTWAKMTSKERGFIKV
jgi:glutaminyl-tRNA synthetase